MNKKICCFTLIFLFSLNLLFSNVKELQNYNISVLPSNSLIGEIEFGNENSISNFIYNIFQEEFTKEWIDLYVSEEYKYYFSKKFSKSFLDILPLSQPFYCSKEKTFKNNISISIYTSDKIVLNIILDKTDNKIINISI